MLISWIKFGERATRMPLRSWGLSAAALLCLAPSAMAANIYRWTDANGVVHYSQTPPPQAPSTVVHPGVPSAMEAPPPAPVEPAAAPATTADAGLKATPEQLQAACIAARERLAFLESRPPRRIAVADADGKVSRMDETRWQQERDEAMDSIRSYCR